MTSILYPKVHSDFIKFIAKYGKLSSIPSEQFWYGMGIGDHFMAELEDGTTVEVVCTRVSNLLPTGEREVTFTVDGKEIRKKVKDAHAAGPNAFDGPMAEPGNAKHLASPMSGVVDKFFVKEGDTVKNGTLGLKNFSPLVQLVAKPSLIPAANLGAGDPIACVCAMKMDVKVVAQGDCVISSFAVAEGDKVIGGALIGTLA
jgi:pyruvate carboxylase|eukprot:SAG25_NODE_336_length_9546_cov_18.211390_4_plen_201_part_00